VKKALSLLLVLMILLGIMPLTAFAAEMTEPNDTRQEIIIDYINDKKINDGSGDYVNQIYNCERVITDTFLCVNEGDRIVSGDSNIKFICYAYHQPNVGAYLGWVDSNPEDSTTSLKNWGNDFTFTDTLPIFGDSVPVNYPLYIRVVFRKTDGSAIYIEDVKTTAQYSVSGEAADADVPVTVSEIWNNNKLISHRGLSSAAPENTFAALEAAYDAGLRIIEVDVQMTADNVPMLLHDSSIDRTSDGSGSIKKLTFEQAKAYDYGSWFGSAFAGQQIPALAEALAWAKSKDVALELDLASRGFTNVQKYLIYSTVRDADMLGQVVFTATDRELDFYRMCNKNIIVSVSVITSVDAANKILPDYMDGGLVLASVPVGNLSGNLIDCIHDFGMKVKVWTVNEEAKLRECINYGADFVLSDSLTSCEDEGSNTNNCENGTCSGGKATCVERAVCIVCQNPYGDLLEHTEVIDEAIEATCTATGLTEGSHCDVCGEVIIKQDVVDMIDHTYDDDFDDTCNECGHIREVDMEFIPGDADGNGVADSSDAVMILRALAGYAVENFNEEAADFDRSGTADSTDAVMILRKLAGYN